jgi:hypothetical protein
MGGVLLGLLARPAFCPTVLAVELRTDRSKTRVPLDEISSGGPPPDGIPDLATSIHSEP